MEVKLSVVIITLNEEKNIDRCLLSVSDIADDIVVVDSFSTDNTENICRKRGVRFVQHKFDGHIEQKNWAITQAKYPYILSLDADEALSIELAKEIIQVKSDWKYDGYIMKRLNNFCGKWIKHCGWYPDKKLRLWDSRKGKWEGINPHDKFILAKGSSISQLKGNILHYSFYSISQHLEQIDKFSGIKARAEFDMGRRSNIFKIVFIPMFKFFMNYFIRLGFLDGYYGFIVCKNSAFYAYIRYVKLKQLQDHEK
ncbi:MAG: glycosyltransferase family 2 protein [Bacteroidales bacterium]|nr:MAG: glycosyltransferase family 2 protein [Bacteroidales bacterium]